MEKEYYTFDEWNIQNKTKIKKFLHRWFVYITTKFKNQHGISHIQNWHKYGKQHIMFPLTNKKKRIHVTQSSMGQILQISFVFLFWTQLHYSISSKDIRYSLSFSKIWKDTKLKQIPIHVYMYIVNTDIKWAKCIKNIDGCFKNHSTCITSLNVQRNLSRCFCKQNLSMYTLLWIQNWQQSCKDIYNIDITWNLLCLYASFKQSGRGFFGCLLSKCCL